MSADAQLQDAYREWRRLAQEEGDAIRANDWTAVSNCQGELQKLQPRIIHWTAEAQQEWSRLGVDRKARENSFRSVVSELIELEWRNNALINVLRQATLAELQKLDEANHTLKRVHRSYSQPSQPCQQATWNSFS